MNIRGIYKTTLIDYPGRISAAIFTGGCNLRCRYCHNPSLVLPGNDENAFTEDEIFELLIKRKNLIEGVTITGGEPTLNSDLDRFMRKIKNLGLDVKLDTNGLKPDMVASLLEQGLVDYIALDIKTSPDKYKTLTGKDVDFRVITATVNIIRESGVAYEMRTTCVPEYVTIDDFHAIRESIGYVDRYNLQQYVAEQNLIDSSFRSIQPYPVKVLYQFRDVVLTFAGECEIRGI
jgi:pyruvate formate lyase activating enzyme